MQQTENGPMDRRAPVRLRPYQQDAIDRLQALVDTGARRIVIVAATGSGKTTIAAHIIREQVEQGARVLFIAHRRELISQAYHRFVQIGIPEEQVGVVMAGDPRRRPGAMVQVASISTLIRRTRPRADVVFVDECHRAIAKSFRDVANNYPDAIHLGLTATPYRANGNGLGDAYDELLVVASPQQLIDEGYLVQPRVFTIPASERPDLSGVRIRQGDYDKRALAQAVDRKALVGNLVEHWKRHARDVRTVAFAVSVEHSKHIAAQFQQEGIVAEHLDGKTPTQERDAMLGRLETGGTKVVSNCGVLCLDAKTEILTASGWTSIDRMTPNHFVAGWRDGRIDFEKPQAVHRRDRLPGERMVVFQSEFLDIRVTEGHGIVHRTSPDAPWQKKAARKCVGKPIILPMCGQAQFVPIGFPCVGVEKDAPDLFALDSDRIDPPQRPETTTELSSDDSGFSDPSFTRLETWLESRTHKSDLGSFLCAKWNDIESESWRLEGVHKAIYFYHPCKTMIGFIQAIAACRGFRTVRRHFLNLSSPAVTISRPWDPKFATARLEFDQTDHIERVWCVTTKAGNIVTRRNGCVVVLGNCEGWDQPAAKCAILARPTQSTGLYLQQAGRILRPWNGQRAIVLDHAGCVLQHGFPQEEREFTLDKAHKPKRNNGQAPVRECPECHAVVSVNARICPECGTELLGQRDVPSTTNGTLIEVATHGLKVQRTCKTDQESKQDATRDDAGAGPKRQSSPAPRRPRCRTALPPAVDAVLRDAARRGVKITWAEIDAAQPQQCSK